MAYNWQLKNWPNFKFDKNLFDAIEKEFLFNAGRTQGKFSHIDTAMADQTLVDLLVNEAIKSSAIEGEMISRVDLISSIKRNLGFDTPNFFVKDKRSAGFAKLLVSSREGFNKPLTQSMLFDWHCMLMEGTALPTIGGWRHHPEPMQIISGSIGREKIHFEAPPSDRVSIEMNRFVDWFNDRHIHNPLVKAAIAHLYFESIHPFEDGNGRIGRVIAEKALSIGLLSPVMFSISSIIENRRNEYYQQLKNHQSTLEINEWISWFCEVVLEAQQSFDKLVSFSIIKATFYDKNQKLMNIRQLKVISRMLEEGENFIGGMSSKKYISIAKTSKASATRDLQDLVVKNILKPDGEGRSRNYQVILG